MSLAAIGAGAAYEFRWRSWALLRDAIVALLEGGEPSFPCFASIGDALVSGRITLDGRALVDEIERLRVQLTGRPLETLVIGPRTAAVLYWGINAQSRRRLTRNELENIRPIGDSADIADYFATMLDSLERVARHPNEDGTIEIVDG